MKGDSNGKENLSVNESGPPQAPSQTMGDGGLQEEHGDVRPDVVVWRAGYVDQVNQAIHDYVECVIDHSHSARYVDSSKRSSVDYFNELGNRLDAAKTAMLVAVLTHCELRDQSDVSPANVVR